MGEIRLPQEVIEHVLQFADGETLLVCKEVSPEFEAAVEHLEKSKNIWEKCYLKEKGGIYPYSVISKLHPHEEGISHPKNWSLIYETEFSRSQISNSQQCRLTYFKMDKDYSVIMDVQTHGELILVLVKYLKNFSVYYKILVVNLDDVVIDKSCRFMDDAVYVSAIKDTSMLREDAIILSCDSCNLIAVPVTNVGSYIDGYPKFNEKFKFLTIEHSNGDVLWLNNFGGLLNKGNSFHMGLGSVYKDIVTKEACTMKVFQRATSLFVICGNVQKEFNTFEQLRAIVTVSKHYSNVLILGTDTGMLYMYHLDGVKGLKSLNLKYYMWNFDVCEDSILFISVIELKEDFVIVCSSTNCIYKVHIKRILKTF